MLAGLVARNSSNPGYPLTLLKFWLVVTGIYLWEFVTTLDYEWSVFRGHRSYGWTIWIYEIARFSTLMSIVLDLFLLSSSARLHCQPLDVLDWMFSLLSIAAGSLLIVLRIVAIWNKNKVALVVASSLWLVNVGFFIACLTRIRAVWSPVAKQCILTNVETSRPSIISLLVSDFLLLLIMLAGLLRLRRKGGGTFRLGRFLWRQGLIWFFISFVTEFLQVLLLILNINDTLDNLFLFPCQVTLVIASTRLYRSLVDFTSPLNSDDSINYPQTPRSTQNTCKHAPVVHVSSNRLEVTVHKADEEHAMTTYPSSGSDGQLHDSKLHEITFDDNMEDRAEK